MPWRSLNIRNILLGLALLFQILSFSKLSGYDYISLPIDPGQAVAPLGTSGVAPSSQPQAVSSTRGTGTSASNTLPTVLADANSFTVAEQPASPPDPRDPGSTLESAQPMDGSGGLGGRRATGESAGPTPVRNEPPSSPPASSPVMTGTNGGVGGSTTGDKPDAGTDNPRIDTDTDGDTDDKPIVDEPGGGIANEKPGGTAEPGGGGGAVIIE